MSDFVAINLSSLSSLTGVCSLILIVYSVLLPIAGLLIDGIPPWCISQPSMSGCSDASIDANHIVCDCALGNNGRLL